MSFNWNSHLLFSLCSISVQFSGLKHELTKFTAPLPITLTLDLAIPLYSRYLLVAVALFFPKTTLNFFAKYSSVPKQSVYPKIEIVSNVTSKPVNNADEIKKLLVEQIEKPVRWRESVNNMINSGVSKVMIERTSKKCFVTIYTSRPGFVIGKKGSDIEKIKKKLSDITSNEVVLNIKEVKKPETNSYLVAENIAQQLVKRISYRKAMKRAMQSAIRLGAKGIKVSISGRLGGNEIARTEWLRDGAIPAHTLRADIDYAEAEALTTYGIIGIKVWIYKGEVFAREFNQETNKVTPKEGKQ